MTDPKVNKQPQAKTVVSSESSPGNATAKRDSVPSQDMVSARAYELYENRGREPGQDAQDWFRAERELLNRER